MTSTIDTIDVIELRGGVKITVEKIIVERMPTQYYLEIRGAAGGVTNVPLDPEERLTLVRALLADEMRDIMNLCAFFEMLKGKDKVNK